jgi:predicted O-methyltransferase YrrM
MIEYWKQAEGWFNYHLFYNTILNDLKDGDTIVEVGTYKGKSILYLAEGIQERKLKVRLYGVDSFVGESTVNETSDDIRNAYHRNIEPFKDKIITIERPSLEAVDTFADGSLAFVFIDAAHDYDNVKADILAWLPKVKKGGILAGHDYNHPPVRKAVDELLTGLKHYHGNVWAYDL